MPTHSDPVSDAPDTKDALIEDPRMPRRGQWVTDRYEVKRVLGAGGFGVVYLAEDHRLGGEVALKVLDPNKSDVARFAARFRQEVLVVRKLKHHNTIKVLDIGTTDDNCLFMAMEYVEGETLDKLIRQTGGLDPGRVVRICAQILKSLDEAHAKGVIHRDLKPNNIMVSQVRGEPDYVKVLDFGVAKALSPELSRVKTSTMELMCTPVYAPPELLDAKGVGPASDLYSLGLMMIEMLTGEELFPDMSLFAIVHRQLTSEPLEIPGALLETPLAQVIERAIRKPMADRYQDASDMLRELLALRLYPSGVPTLTGPQSAEPFTSQEYLRDTEPDLAKHTPKAVPDESEAPAEEPPRSDLRRRLSLGLIVASLVVIAVSAWAIVDRYNSRRAVVDRGRDASAVSPGGDAGGVDDPVDERLAAVPDVESREEPAAERDPAPQPDELSALIGSCHNGTVADCLEAAERLSELEPSARALADPANLLQLACDGEHWAACVRLGELREAAATTPIQDEEAVRLYRRACDNDAIAGCVRLGAMYARARGVPRDDVQAVELYRRACDLGTMEGCVNLGWMYFSGQGVGQSYELAHAFFQQACNGGSMQGCGVLGFLYHQGYGFGQDYELARFHYTRACDGGDMTGCTGLAALYEQGLGVELDVELAFAYYERACAADAGTACNRLGQLYSEGLHVEVDAARSQAFFERACQLGYGQACTQLQ